MGLSPSLFSYIWEQSHQLGQGVRSNRPESGILLKAVQFADMKAF